MGHFIAVIMKKKRQWKLHEKNFAPRVSIIKSDLYRQTEKNDHPHVTDEEEKAKRWHSAKVLTHCVTLPPAEHLLGIRKK